MCLLPNEVGAVVMGDTAGVGLLNTSASVFIAKAATRESQALEIRESLGNGRLPCGQGGSDQRSSGQTQRTEIHGPRWDAPVCAVRADRRDHQTTPHHLSQVMENRRGARGLQDGQCLSSVQKGHEGASGKVQASQPRCHPRKVVQKSLQM